MVQTFGFQIPRPPTPDTEALCTPPPLFLSYTPPPLCAPHCPSIAPQIIPFILTLRSKALNTMQAIIFAAHTHGPTPDQLNKIARFPSVYVIVEDNVDEIFRRTLIHRAKVCVLLPSCSEIRDVESSEARVTVILFKLRQWPQVRIVATLPSAKWALFYFPGEAYRSRADEQLDCSPAAFATQMHTQVCAPHPRAARQARDILSSSPTEAGRRSLGAGFG